ncbi:molybdenum cofactor guanylyltransferase [Brevundimonas sp.]|uniref:molybdenum cofactor guanylyltransferase n=1 Tax=Brevundimonas sp. TaxID=1871086 RepID=UPI0028A178B0|nr:molybdenum cofactor guanylyltransferase [Brevundimonas sp.]
MIVGLLLAGGRSCRFGTDKATHPLDDGVMMDAPLAGLAAISDRIAVSARPGSPARTEAVRRRLACLTDAQNAPAGPLAGIQAGLAWAATLGADWLATAPCDAPTITARLFEDLRSALQQGAVAAVARSPAGNEPLIAIWPVSAAGLLIDRALASGGHPPVRRLLSAMGATEVAGHDGRNINTPEDLACLLSDRPS